MIPKLSMKIRSNILDVIRKKVLPPVQKASNRALPKVASRITALVIAEARSKLRSTAPLYERALSDPTAVQIVDNSVSITIKDPVVRALEHGFKSFDIKVFMLRHAKIGKNGSPYADVPFTHESVPGAVSRKLQKVDRVRFSSAARQKKTSVRRRLDGVMRSGGAYRTIRRISLKSPLDSWIHPGFKGLQLFKKLNKKIREEVISTVTSELSAGGLKAKRV